MSPFMFPSPEGQKSCPALDEPHEEIARDIIGKPRPKARIIAVSNDKGGVGKSTIAFNLIAALATAGLRVAAVDCGPRRRSLTDALAGRKAIAQRLAIDLSLPQDLISHVDNGTNLCEELRCVGEKNDVIVIDDAQIDRGIGRRVLAIADTVLTPVSEILIDDDHPAHADPSAFISTLSGQFGATVEEIRELRTIYGLRPFDWILFRNRVRHDGGSDHLQIKAALEARAPGSGFRLAPSIAERKAYREFFELGLTHLDMQKIPDLPPASTLASREILRLLAVITSPFVSTTDDDALASLPTLSGPTRSSGLVSFFQQ